jgi:hypothetical protein
MSQGGAMSGRPRSGRPMPSAACNRPKLLFSCPFLAGNVGNGVRQVKTHLDLGTGEPATR